MFRDSSLDPKQLSLFCLLWLISACAAGTAFDTLAIYIAWQNCCTSSKTAVVITEAFRHLV